MIVCGDQEGTIYLLDASLGELAQIFSDQTPDGGPVNGLAWSPAGQVLVSAHPDGRVRWWDYPSGRLVRTIQAHEGWARGVAWSPDGRLLATTGADKHIRLWETSTGRLYAQEKHNFLPVWSCSWSPDGKQVASGAGAFNQTHSGATVIWDVP
jgi:WD40 repeat protein